MAAMSLEALERMIREWVIDEDMPLESKTTLAAEVLPVYARADAIGLRFDHTESAH